MDLPAECPPGTVAGWDGSQWTCTSDNTLTAEELLNVVAVQEIYKEGMEDQKWSWWQISLLIGISYGLYHIIKT